MSKLNPSVLIDFERLKYPNCGLGQYSLNLAKEISRQADSQWRPYYLLPSTLVGEFGKQPRYIPVRGYLKKIRFTLPKVNLWHMTHQDSEYGPASRRVPTLLTIHDLNFLREKEPEKAQARLKQLQQRVDQVQAITTVSQYTADDVRKHLNVGSKPVFVIHNGVDLSHLDTAPESTRPEWAPDKPFLLALGVVTRKKNFHTLVELMKRFPQYDLVIAGYHERDYVMEIRDLMNRNNVEHQIALPGEVSGGVKTWLFQNCSAFLFPSLLEGFGIPVVEAMSFGKPVFCSDKCSLPEIGGDQAYYWSDFAPDEMAKVLEQGLREVAQNPSAKSAALIAHARKYTWDRAAREYISVYKKILGI